MNHGLLALINSGLSLDMCLHLIIVLLVDLVLDQRNLFLWLLGDFGGRLLLLSIQQEICFCIALDLSQQSIFKGQILMLTDTET